jgi:hypothetical protein
MMHLYPGHLLSPELSTLHFLFFCHAFPLTTPSIYLRLCRLWDHLSSNLHLYVQPKATTSNDEPKSIHSAGRGLPVRSLTSSVQVNCELEAEAQKTTRVHQKREWGRINREQSEAFPLRSVVANVSHAEEKDFHESHAEERDFHKSHAGKRTRSPDLHNHRKRSREADSRSTKVSNPL